MKTHTVPQMNPGHGDCNYNEYPRHFEAVASFCPSVPSGSGCLLSLPFRSSNQGGNVKVMMREVTLADDLIMFMVCD